MNPIEAATASGNSINEFASLFMIDMATYVKGAELGYEGTDFYVAGRGGVLGDVPAEDVADAFVHFEPANIATSWARTASHPRATTAQEFADAGYAWAEANVPDGLDLARTIELAAKVGDDAAAAFDPAEVPLFVGWRALPDPGADRPKAQVLYRMNALRELRGAIHGAAVRAEGLTPVEAVGHHTPYMLGIFGWLEPHPPLGDDVPARWQAAQDATEVALAPAFTGLDQAERTEFVALVDALLAAVTAA